MDITGAHIEHVAKRLFGSAGPCGTDSDHWRAFLLRFGNASTRLREAVTASTRRHANEVVPWSDIRAFLARRGIALDKQPGVRPIDIGECRQRIEAKAMALATGQDVQETCGADQLCSGAKAGIEAAVHSMSQLFNQDETEGLLLLDAANAFNSISRPAALWNCRVLWPRCSRFLFNCYRGFPVVVLKDPNGAGTHTILSREGTTQGCPLAMLMYAIGIQPLIERLKAPSHHIQNWYADESSCLGRLLRIKEWFLSLLEQGPAFGYFAEPSKSIVIVKPHHVEAAKTIFGNLNVQVTTSGGFLGSYIGDPEGVSSFVRSRVSD